MNKTYSLSNILSGRLIVRTRFFVPLLITVAIGMLFASCKKDNQVGIDVQPEEDIIGLYTTDTLTLLTTTVREDSMRTDETPTVVVGTCQDAIFGKSTCGLFSQFSIPNNLGNINFQNDGPAILDSAVLMLAYDFDFYGDTLQQQTFSVFQMTDMLHKDSVYYSNRPKNYYPQPIGSLTFEPRPRTSVEVGTDSTAPHIRIAIDMTWAQQIFDEGIGSGGELESNASWLEFMNGLYIQPGTTGGSLLYFNMLDSLTGLRLYYHNASDTTSFTFVVNSSTAYYSYYQHDYTSSTVGSAIGVADLSYNYIQSNAGVKTKIEFPSLNGWYNSLGFEAAINKAELVIFGDASQASDNFPLNIRLFATSIDSVGKEHLLIDMFESQTYYGGSLNTTTNVYKINIARYLQSIVTGTQQNNGIYLKEIFGTENGRRSVIGSGSSQFAPPGLKMYLRLVYTRIN